MSQIEELQSRITAAMERIGNGVAILSETAEAATASAAEATAEAAALAEAQANAEPDAELTAALEEERLVNAQLEERVKRLKARHAEELAAAQASTDDNADDGALMAEVDALKAELEELKAESAKVSDLETELASAKDALASVQDSEEVEALKAELDAARAQLNDTSEVDALRSEIDTLKSQLDGAAELGALRAELEGQDVGPDTEALKSDLATMKAEYQIQANAMADLDVDMQRLRKSNEQLREAITTLRDANAAGVGDPSLINQAMLAELEGLRATRASDVAEAGAVLARLEPLLAQAANLPEGEAE